MSENEVRLVRQTTPQSPGTRARPHLRAPVHGAPVHGAHGTRNKKRFRIKKSETFYLKSVIKN